MSAPAPEPPHPRRRRRIAWRQLAWRVGRTLLLTYLGILLVFTLLQRSLMYPAFASGRPLDAAEFAAELPGHTLRDVTATTADGLELHGWLAGADADGPPHGVVLWFHGNGGDRRRRLGELEPCLSAGWDVAIFDYRGYAENPGSPSQEGLTLDAAAAWEWAKGNGYAPDEIVLFGESLGGAVAVHLAADLSEAGTPPAGLVVRSTFDTMTDTAARLYRWLPVRLLLRDRWESVGRAAVVTCPVLQLHGSEDTLVLPAAGERLFDAFPAESAAGVPRRFVTLAGAGHNDTRYTAGPVHDRAVREFLNALAAGDGVPGDDAADAAIGVPAGTASP